MVSAGKGIDAPVTALRSHDGTQGAERLDPSEAEKGRAFAPVRKKDLGVLYRQFQVLRPEPIFIDIYEPMPFPTLERFVKYFAVDRRPMWVMGPLPAPSAYVVLHDFQREHDLANLDLVFFAGYPEPDSEAACHLGTFLMALAADHGLTRMQSFVLTSSVDKIRLIESLGFRREGVLREHYFHDGALHDVVIHAWMAEGRGDQARAG